MRHKKIYILLVVVLTVSSIFVRELTQAKGVLQTNCLAVSSLLEKKSDEALQIRWSGFKELERVPSHRTFIFKIDGQKIVRHSWDKLTPQENRIIHSTPPKFIRRKSDTASGRTPRKKVIEFTLDPSRPLDRLLLSEESKWDLIGKLYKPKLEVFIRDLRQQLNNNLVSVLISGSLAGGYFIDGSDMDVIIFLEDAGDYGERLDLKEILSRGMESIFDIHIYDRYDVKACLDLFQYAEQVFNRFWPKFRIEHAFRDAPVFHVTDPAVDYSLLKGSIVIWGENIFAADEPSRDEFLALQQAV